MAKTSQIARNRKRKRMAENQKAVRAELRKKAIDPNLSEEEREQARFKLQSLPRNGSATRFTNRCLVTGRRHGVYRKFMISRIVLRQMAHEGLIPGLKKSSW
ncbi:MAG: 30S ribosomal protein S14 [Candidatus Omnitrophica bacterium]|nr:30S ribosomal protein S14 [Candidatus Omnitrophota bacterium]MCA9418074.1 30S ribosomal protein S14 [Candidatus Omnitrophota bacterium]MCA9445146.1 30S ribosomal protein S14 [Candidatus Omnitrophota bacterium]